MKRVKYTISSTLADSGKMVWYCHLEGFSNVPVFGSIGSKRHAVKYMHMMNVSIGAENPARKISVPQLPTSRRYSG